ncbi:MAG: exosome complex component RRP42 [Amphiamblys sp. WSBS2006]|nr:MAG: exosome complex component RRP42 [Amphiamblys sp. WSBS2006]
MQHTDSVISSDEKKIVRRSVSCGVRLDGRQNSEPRTEKLETGVLPTASGSCSLHKDGMDILVAVHTEVGEYETRGASFSVTIKDTSDRKEPDKEKRTELEDTLQDMFAHLKHQSELTVADGEWGWCLDVTVLVLGNSGGVLDSVVLACSAALQTTKIPEIAVCEDGTFSVDEEKTVSVRPEAIPLSVTLYCVGEHLVVDPLATEEFCSNGALTATVYNQALQTICGDRVSVDEKTLLLFSQIETHRRSLLALK